MTLLGRNTLLLSFFMITLTFVKCGDICDYNCRCLDIDADKTIVNCKGYKGHTPEIDFDMMEWPRTTNRSILGFFNFMSLRLLPKISGDSNVISLNFDDNLIRTLVSNPFEYFNNLETISLANNFISELTKDFLKSTTNLKTLILSNNSLSTIDPIIVSHLKNLREINLSLNEFTKLSADLLEALSSVEVLRMENNKLFTIDNAYNKIDYQLRQLFLGYNQFTVITGSMFENFMNLESIDLSNNKIKNIDENAFASLDSLKLLDLSKNNIRQVNLELPNSLLLIAMANNELAAWPFSNIPESLEQLELHFNCLEVIFPKDRSVKNLKLLDVSNNVIENMPNTQFFKLEKLDLSYNHFTSVPENLNSMAPLLHDLILDGNPISSIYINENTVLGSISLKELTDLETIDEGAFSNLSGFKITADGTGTCVDVFISNNKNLREIDSRAFEGVDFCYLDLSYNQLMQIPKNLTDWSKIQEGIDLQGNPLACNCEDEWMIHDILEKLYSRLDHQFLLIDLKCEAPKDFKGVRFVQFLNHEEPFCDPNLNRKGFEKIIEGPNTAGIFPGIFSSGDSKENINFELTHGPGFVIIVTMCVLILVLMIFFGVRWQREHDRKRARRNRFYGYDDY
ncbi:CLUMA_CG019046, isoform A [Clunio marinus]|uniref:CLUMA_CG019046, isoform A n=1 Tax=Clunio marinus TaxID=568069 RepID=A0A1J1J5Q2_9DIPT|nr:CLUMA_CG019046, isoform A [Clunio marinus]